MATMRIFLTILLLCLSGRVSPAEKIRGIIVSCHQDGRAWAGPAMERVVKTVPDVGANFVAIHPYAWVSRKSGRVSLMPKGRLDHVENPVRFAHACDLKIMMKPHLAYWGQFSWRGEVGFPEGDPRWEVFERSYREAILTLASASEKAGADLFVVGTELRQTEPRETYWRSLISDIRKVFKGSLTYAANWDDYERVPFWDALDFIGIQAYFPLSKAKEPEDEELHAGYKRYLRAIEAFSRRKAKPVLFTEIGYSNGPFAASEPWRSNRAYGESDLQARCLRVALEEIETSKEVVGAFIWKWFPTMRPPAPRDFVAQTEEMKKVISSVWR